MPTGRPRILGLQHVALPFPGTPESVVQARHYFGEVLGLDERPAPPTLPGVLWYAVGDQELHLITEPAGVAVNAKSRRHPCFQVDDVDRFRSHLAARGISTIDAEGDIPGRLRFFALDPFGNAIEFVEIRPTGQ